MPVSSLIICQQHKYRIDHGFEKNARDEVEGIHREYRGLSGLDNAEFEK